MTPAGFWLRGGALAIDAVLCVVLSLLLSLPLLAVRGRGAGLVLAWLIGFLAPLAYYTVAIGTWGTTAGKLAAGLRVVRSDGGPVGYGRALGRYLAYFLSGFPLLLGYLAAVFTPGKRALHDYVAGTRVVYGVATPPWRRGLVISALAAIILAPLGVEVFFVWKSVAKRAGPAVGANASLRP